MKNQNQIFKTVLLTLLTCSVIATACKKESATQKQQQQINQVLPQKYIDTLKNLGITIYDGTTPPTVNGIYIISPFKLKATTLSSDFPIGTTFLDAKLKLENQNNTDFSINILGKNFLANNDTSIISAISGSGNNFTVYGKVKATNGTSYAYFALVMSGTMSGTAIQNFEVGLINIDNSHGNGLFMPEGAARLIYDADFTSVTTTVFRIATETMPKEIKLAGLR